MNLCREGQKVFGKINNYRVEGNKLIIEYENIEATISIISDEIINFFVPLFRKERNSKAVESIDSLINNNESNFKVDKIGDAIKFVTDKLVVKIYNDFIVDIYDSNNRLLCSDYRGNEEAFRRRYGDYELAEAEGHSTNKDSIYKVYVAKTMEEDMHFYGFGEKTGHLDKKRYHYVNWNTDNPAPHGETFDRLYQSVPFFIGLNKADAFGIFFDNHFETHFDMGRDNSKYYYFSAMDGNLDYYFIYGKSIQNIVKGYTTLTGTMPLPQKWTLGYQQCRWSYDTEERVMEIAENFRKRDIPCDTIYLDIDYMDGYRVFTWNNKRFKNPEYMIKKLKDMGFKVVTIIDPGVKVDKNYEIYNEGLESNYFATDKNGITYVNEVWPGDSVYPDFINSDVRKWWASKVNIMMDYGISGIWNDMNEPASFRGPLPNDVMFNNDGTLVEHREVHNVYGHFMSKATYEGIKSKTNKRPFVVSRAGYSGTQKYSTVWTGDNQSTWEQLRMSIPMLMNMGLSGMTFCGIDVGGFGHDCTDELLSRWVQVGAFTPLFRNHSVVGTRDQEPWAFDEKTEDINRKYIKLRYKLIPYMYDTMWKSSISGAPFLRPLLFNYQSDENTYEINDEFLCGDNILVAPVLEQGLKCRMIYLPKGNNWIDYWTKEEFEGGQYIIKNTPLDVCPIFIKSGTVIPICEEQQYIGEKENSKLNLEIYLGDNRTREEYIHYIDDGESFRYEQGEYNIYKIEVENNESLNISINRLNNKFNDTYKEIELIIFNCRFEYVNLNGEKMKVNNDKLLINISRLNCD